MNSVFVRRHEIVYARDHSAEQTQRKLCIFQLCNTSMHSRELGRTVNGGEEKVTEKLTKARTKKDAQSSQSLLDTYVKNPDVVARAKIQTQY